MSKKISEKLTNTHSLSIEGTFNFDEIENGKLIMEVEDEGEINLIPLLKKFNSEYGKMTLNVKIEENPEEAK